MAKKQQQVLQRYAQSGSGFFLGWWHPGFDTINSVKADPRQLFKPIREDAIFLGVLALAGCLLRLRGLSSPPVVIHDELEIISHVNQYIKGQFFVGMGPQLSSLVYYFLAKQTGYDGSFDATAVGQVYQAAFPYVRLRAFSATLGILSVLLTYLTLRKCAVSTKSAAFGASLLLLENSFATDQRYFVPNSISLFSLILSVHLWKSYSVHTQYSLKWVAGIFFLSLSLGATASASNSGTYIMVFTAIAAFYRLCWDLSDRDRTIKSAVFAFFVQFFFCLVIPVFVYIAVGLTHVTLTPKAPVHDYNISGKMHFSLEGNNHDPVIAHVPIDSYITIRHMYANGYLQSKELFYPDGSQQQLVSLNKIYEANNYWRVEHARIEDIDKVNPLHDGAIIRLAHVLTGRRLHSHEVKAPATESDWQFEVSAYGADGFPGDINDMWKVEIVKSRSAPGTPQHQWEVIRTVFRLQHFRTGCYLFSHHVRLPPWGENKYEVTCVKSGKFDRTLWYAESNINNNLVNNASTEFVTYKPLNIADKYSEYMDASSNLATYHLHNAGKPNLNRPIPLLAEGVKYGHWNKAQTMLFGNVAVWSIAVISLAAYGVVKLVILISNQRQMPVIETSMEAVRFDHEAGILVVGWFIHFTALFDSKLANMRDYMPALYFAILQASILWDFLLSRNRKLQWIIYLFAIGTAWNTFWVYSPLIYGSQWDVRSCERANFGDWMFQCNSYKTDDWGLGGYYTNVNHDEDIEVEDLPTVEDFVNRKLNTSDPDVHPLLMERIRSLGYDDNSVMQQYFPELKEPATSTIESKNSHQLDLESRIVTQWSLVTAPPIISNSTSSTAAPDNAGNNNSGNVNSGNT